MGADLGGLVLDAEAAMAAVGEDPAGALAMAASVADRARALRSWEAEAVAERAAARAECDRGDHAAARLHIRRALAAASRCGLANRLVEARTTAAHIWFLSGERRRAFEALAEAEAHASGPLAAKVAAQRTLLLWRTGRLDDAIASAQAILRSGIAQPEVEADVLVYLGGLFGEQGRHAEAEAAFRASQLRCEGLRLTHKAATALYNRALVYALQGDIPASLHAFDEVERRLATLGASLTWLLVGRTHVLLTANLVGEALEAAERAVSSADRRAPLDVRAEAWWRLADARLRAGDRPGARMAAASAARMFSRLDNDGRAAIAQRVEVRARAAGGRSSLQLLERATATVDALTRAGLHGDAVEARIDLVRIAQGLGRSDRATAELEGLRALRGRGPTLVRARACYGEALALASLEDRGRAERALQRGLRLLDEHRASLGSTELRAEASGHGAEMAELGIRLALARGRPGAVLRSAERWRGGVVWRRPVSDPEVAGALAALRVLRAERESTAGTGGDVVGLLRREAQIEATIRGRSRQATGGTVSGPVDALDLPALHEALAERALLEVVAADGRLHAVVVAGGRCTLHRLGPSGAVASELGALGFALRRLGRPLRPDAAAAARRSSDHALAQLEAHLVAPVSRRLDGRAVVVVPPAALHAVPWGSLPALSNCAVSVVPSAAWWMRDGATPDPGERPVLVAGPGLVGAAAEVVELARRYPAATVLSGAQATSDAVGTALEGAALAHLACHGRFRADNPLFSALELADGPLTVYDLERLARAPARVVLSACDSGVSAVRPGDELLGLLTSLFALGTASVVASVVPVPDLDTRDLMVALHDRLRAGDPPAAALLAARRRSGPGHAHGLRHPHGLRGLRASLTTPRAGRLRTGGGFSGCGAPAGGASTWGRVRSSCGTRAPRHRKALVHPRPRRWRRW